MLTIFLVSLTITFLVTVSIGKSSAANAVAIKRVAPAVNSELDKFQKKFVPPKLVKMGDKVKMAFGYDYANFAFIEGNDGVIMIDTGFYSNRAQHALDDYRKLVKKPVTAIIYTHVHYDHRGGSPVFVKDAGKDIPVYAPGNWQKQEEYDRSNLRPMIVKRGLSQFGILLPAGKEGTVGAGIGPVTRKDGTAGFVLPTISIKEKTEMTISGVRMVLIPTPGDIDSHMMVWLPEEKVLFTGDLLGGTLPYVATARFEAERKALKFVASLDLALQYPAQHAVPGHGRPLLGKEDVHDVLLANRDTAQFLADQVTRYVVKGYSPDQIIDTLKLPPHIASHPDLQPHYHRLDWLIRGLYLKRAGWVTDLVSIVRHTDSKEAKRLVELLGGKKTVVNEAIKAHNKDDYRWAARLAQYVLLIDPENELALDVQTESFKGIAYTTVSANERNYLLTSIKKDIPWKMVYAGTGMLVRAKQPNSELLELMQARFKAENALEKEMTIGINIDGEDGGHTFEVRRGILLYKKTNPETADGRASFPRELLVKLSIGAISWSDALEKKLIKIESGIGAVKKFASLIEPIVENKIAAEVEKASAGKTLKAYGTVYNHPSPAFSIIYPDSLSKQDPDPGCYFTATGGMFPIPKMNVLSEKDYTTPDNFVKNTVKILEKGKKASNCEVLYSKKTQLEDGTPAFETLIKWDHPFIPGLYTAKIVAKKGNSIIAVSITDKKKLSDEYLQCLKSLKIK
jgi:uncharacterized sulfatase